MLDQVRKGTRHFGPKTVRVLCDIECELGCEASNSNLSGNLNNTQAALDRVHSKIVKESHPEYCVMTETRITELEDHNSNMEERIAILEAKLDQVLGAVRRGHNSILEELKKHGE